MTTEEKYEFLRGKIYKNITHSKTGKLLINTKYCRKVAEILGGNYDQLTESQKILLKSDIVFEIIYIEGGFNKYIKQ